MTLTHLILRWAHISMAMLGLVSGAAAMTFAKGSRPHRLAGNVFFVSMLVMSAAGVVISIFITPIMPNVIGGATTFYLVATGWGTVLRKPGETGRLEVGGALLGLATAIAGFTFGTMAAYGPGGMLDKFPATGYFVFANVVLFATALDVRVIAKGGVTGAARTTRHLWRMSLAMFNATASFFLGQAKLFPAEVRKSGVLTIPVLLVLAAMLYWLVRIRVWPWLRTLRAPQVARSSRVG